MEGDTLHIDLIRKPIRNLHLRVYQDGRVVVSAPLFMSQSRIDTFIRSKWQWVMQTREHLRQHPAPSLPVVTREQARELADFLAERVPYWCQIMDEGPVNCKIRNMKTQWGNCRAMRRLITFNLQLARVPNHLRDYIIVHELAHLKIQNHGPLFKERLTLFMPDWKERKKALRAYQ